MSRVTGDPLGPLAAPRSARAYAEHLRGRTMVIFGGSSGIGRELRRLAQGFGADVFSFSRSTTGTFPENPAHVQAALDQVQRATGRIDAIVVTAGLLHRRGERLGHQGGDLVETDEPTVDAMVAANYLAPVTVARAGLPYLRLTRGQLLLYTAHSRGRAGYALYSSMKAAVANLTQALADEWSPAGVRVNCINPERMERTAVERTAVERTAVERTAALAPARAEASGPEPALLSCADVALTSLDVLASELTGQVVEVRLAGPAFLVAVPRPAAAAAQLDGCPPGDPAFEGLRR